MARRRSTRVGFGLGGGTWVSFGRSGPRVGARVGKVRVSTGRSGTRIGARDGRIFGSTWIPNDRRRQPSARSRSHTGWWLFLAICFAIGEIMHLTGHG